MTQTIELETLGLNMLSVQEIYITNAGSSKPRSLDYAGMYMNLAKEAYHQANDFVRGLMSGLFGD